MTEAAAPRLIDALRARAHELAARTAADACILSRVLGDVLIIVTRFPPDEQGLDLGQGFLVSDFPATQAVLASGEPSVLTLDDDDVDAAEAQLLGELGYSTLLMLPLEVVGERWGLVELYRRTVDPFATHEVAVAQELARITAD